MEINKLARRKKIFDVVCNFLIDLQGSESRFYITYQKTGVTLHYINDLKEERDEPIAARHDELDRSFSGRYYSSRVP